MMVNFRKGVKKATNVLGKGFDKLSYAVFGFTPEEVKESEGKANKYIKLAEEQEQLGNYWEAAGFYMQATSELKYRSKMGELSGWTQTDQKFKHCLHKADPEHYPAVYWDEIFENLAKDTAKKLKKFKKDLGEDNSGGMVRL